MARNSMMLACSGDVAGDNIFLFSDGVIGFSEAKHFALLYQGRGDIACLQCVDSYEPALLVTPWDDEKLGEYPKEVFFSKVGCLLTENMLHLIVLNPYAIPGWVTANIRAPIIIDASSGRGEQLILPDESLPIRMKWFELPRCLGG